MRCSCCGEKKDDVMDLKLPIIGYGSLFETPDEKGFHFYLCPKCALKINMWIKKRLPDDVTIGQFWRCEQIEKTTENITYHEYKYEDLLIDVFIKFMPETFLGKHYRIKKIACLIAECLDCIISFFSRDDKNGNND